MKRLAWERRVGLASRLMAAWDQLGELLIAEELLGGLALSVAVAVAVQVFAIERATPL